MDEVRLELASMGLGNLSSAQLASVLGPEEMAVLEQLYGLRSLRADAPTSASVRGGKLEQDEESFIQGRKQDIEHAKEVLEASRPHPLPPKS